MADSIAAVAWYIESKGMVATAEKFTDDIYNYFIKLADSTNHILPAAIPKEELWDTNAFL